MKYTRAQIKEAVRKSRNKWVTPEQGEKVLRAQEACGFCEMVGHNFDVMGGRDKAACDECKNIFWGGESCVQSLVYIDDCAALDSGDAGWEPACVSMQSEFDRIEKEFCEPEVYEVECRWENHESNFDFYAKPVSNSGKNYQFSTKFGKSLIGKRTKLTIEVLD